MLKPDASLSFNCFAQLFKSLGKSSPAVSSLQRNRTQPAQVSGLRRSDLFDAN
ncbi:MAG: hypothetical protein ACJ8CB_35740 [Ktedonobacteraceae bacterium]